MAQTSRGRRLMGEINVVPYIDVMLVLLIIFMVTAPLLAQGVKGRGETAEMGQGRQKVVLFLCTGNYYRSRFAEGLFNGVVGKMNLPWRASSKGLALERGAGDLGPMAAAAVNALKAMGICAEDDCARAPAPVAVDDLERADRIIALKQAEHEPLLLKRFPTWADKVEFWHVEDAPEALAVIEQEITSLVARMR